QPSGARVTVNGILRGYTPLLLTTVAPGAHSVEIALPGHRTFTRNVEVAPGQTTVVNVRLQPRGPSWFFGLHIGD
ncbi:PEGA domain-containing protein, partial [Candidatus Sumerlaeota bacterium]|nr:PEGA domain-containing protein [Candidatus Sumerlaeota bacterium]